MFYHLLGIYSEDAAPSDLADRIDASFPHFGNIGLSQYYTRRIAELDKFVQNFPHLKSNDSCRELLKALQERGFKTTLGIHDTGILMLEETRAGGYYIGISEVYSLSQNEFNIMVRRWS